MNSINAVITVYNKEKTIRAVVESVVKQNMDVNSIFVIDDGSMDGSIEIIRDLASRYQKIIPIFETHRGIVSVSNIGLKRSASDFVIFLDADAVIESDWLEKIMPYFRDEKVGAVSGLIKLADDKSVWACLGGYNLEYRHAAIKTMHVDHVSTCNTVYRKSALDKTGFFDPEFYYGLDNDLSYRITAAGYKLILAKDVFCRHFWPDDFSNFFKQRFNGAVGRMKLIKKYHGRWKGDSVSNIPYFLELPLAAAFAFFLLLAAIGGFSLIAAMAALFGLYVLQAGEIAFFLNKKKILLGLFLPFFSVLRSLAWFSGIVYFYLGGQK
jgi:cellulose synthase/poly-beta-1,6-N-acetylglucosamine synthase-like glycosyltransferase